MIIIKCDICSKEIEVKDFSCEMQVQEIKIALDTQNLNQQQKQMHKQLIQFCRKCYEDKVAILIKK